MNKNYLVLVTAFITFSVFITSVYVSCKKDPCSGINCLNGGVCASGACKCPAAYTGTHCEIPTDPCASVTCLNGSTCNNGVCSCPTGYTGAHCDSLIHTTISYTNNTYTPIRLVANGSTQTIAIGGTINVQGIYGTATNGSAATPATPPGVQITWTVNDTFSATNQSKYFDVSSSYFYLLVVNYSTDTIGTVMVNYGTVVQTTDTGRIYNDGYPYGIGYYKAYTTTAVKLVAIAGTPAWLFTSLGLPFTNNQSCTVYAH